MHKHLTWTDRLKIEKGLKEGLKPCAIADRLHVHNTTIYRELKRGRYTHLNSDLTLHLICFVWRVRPVRGGIRRDRSGPVSSSWLARLSGG